MKFEIDDKTGMITRMVINLYQYPEALEGWETATPKNLEQILQAVKKTQEKLDSKNTTSDEYQRRYEESLEDLHDTFIKKTEKIKQNQKIVDEMMKTYNLFSNVPDKAFASDEIMGAIVILMRIVKEATGKDIKDLS